MTAGDLITRTYQAELQGLLMGADTAYPFSKRKPLAGLGLAPVRDSDVDRPQAHGVFVGPDFMGSKPLTFSFEVFGDDAADVEDLIADLAAAFKPIDGNDTIPLVLRLSGTRKYLVNGRPRRCATDPERMPSGVAQAVAQFTATDPRFYDNNESSGSTGPGVTTGGLAFPFAFPFAFGSSSPGSIDALNEGNIETYGRARVTAGVGGITGFTITKNETGETFAVVLTMSNGDFVDIDFAARTVLLGGSASRIGNVTRPSSTWWALDPGTNTIGFTVTGGGTATLDFYWRSAWVL